MYTFPLQLSINRWILRWSARGIPSAQDRSLTDLAHWKVCTRKAMSSARDDSLSSGMENTGLPGRSML